MRSLLLLLFLLSLAGVALSATQVQEGQVKYSQVRVYITSKDDVLSLSQLGLALDHIDYRGTYFDAVLNNHELAVLRNTGRPYQILVDDMEAEYCARPQLSPAEMKALEAQQRQQYHSPSGFHLGSMGGYYTFDEVVADLDSMRTTYPNLISVRQSIGLSIEGRDLWMVRISNNPDVDQNEPEILFTALHHAREPQGMATVMYFMWYLLENYGTDPNVTDLVNTRELYFVPVVNPDGYVYNQQTDPNGGGFWRKNRRNNGDGTFGVDLNRNYGYEWGYDNIGSSPDTFDETYRGAAAFSEPETQVIRTFADSKQFFSAQNYHSYGDDTIFPWGYIPNFDTIDQSTFVALAQNMTQFNHYIYGHANQTVGYVVNGEANDWFYGEQTEKPKAFAFTTEVGTGSDGFWPSPDRIIPLAQENLYPNLVLASTGGTCPLITIQPFTLPNGLVNRAYSQTLTAIEGTAPYTFALTSGALPAGLTLQTTGVISGTPTAVGTANFQVIATDSAACSGGSNYTLTITCPNITLAPATLPGGLAGTPYNRTITASGGTTPYTFAVTSGALPAGLALDPATGVISGTPTAAETASFQITATDSVNCSGSRNYTIRITCPGFTVIPPALPDGRAGVPYDQTVVPSGGTAPYTFAVTSGTLPPGLTLDPATGNISGAPTADGSFSFTITATDSVGCPGSRPYSINIAGLCDLFDDGVMSPDWNYLKPAWSESGGYLSGTPAGRKATAVATPAFPDCEICNIQTGMRFAGGVDTRMWLLTHYKDKSNTMELLLREATDKVVLKQRVNGRIITKAKANFTIDMNVDYAVELTFDGTQFVVTINGSPVINLTPLGLPPAASIGYQIKNGTGSFDYLCLN